MQTITGQAISQRGNPISNATIASHSITESALDESDARSLEQQAEDLREEATNPLPDSWDPNLDLESHQESANREYLLVHSQSDWGLDSSVFPPTGTTSLSNGEVDPPRLTVEEGEPLVLTVWDASESNGYLSNQVDESFVGTTTKQPVVVEQLSPTGEVTDRTVHDPEVVAKTSGGTWGTENHYGAHVRPPSGVYRAYPEDSPPETGYVFTVGSSSQLANTWESDLRDQAGQLTDRANRIRDLLGGGVDRTTVRTDENGKFTVEVPSNTVKTDLKAMKADGQLLQNVQDPSMTDLRELQATDYNGTFYLPNPDPNTVEPPAEGVTVAAYRSPEVPMGDMETFADLQSYLDSIRQNETMAEMESKFNQKMNETERQTLAQQYKGLRPLVETAPGATEEYLSESQFSEVQDAEDLSKEELYTELPLMRQSLYSQATVPVEPETPEVDVDVEPPDIDYPDHPDSGEDSALSELTDTVVVPEDAVVDARVHWSDGTVEPVPDEHITTDSGLLGDSKRVTITHPVGESDPPQGSLAVQVATSEGASETRSEITNPHFGGDIPSVPAVDLSTMTPGQSDRVSLNLRPEAGSGYSHLVSIDARNPQGEAVSANVTGDSSGWVNTYGQGVHRIYLTYQNDGGTQFQRLVTVRAREYAGSGSRLRVSQGPSGTFALAGNGLDGGRITTDGEEVTIAAIAPTGDVPGRIDIKPGHAVDSQTTSLNVRVLEGDTETATTTNVGLDIHVDSLDEDALLWRGDPSVTGQPIMRAGDTPYGAVTQPSEKTDKAVIRTFTDETGRAEVTITRKDGLAHWQARLTHRTARIVDGIPTSWVPSLGGIGLIGLAGIARRRRAATS
jgi:hypothetical protein